MEILYAILGFIVVTAILTLVSRKQYKSAWKGVLKDKTHTEDDEGGRDYYKLVFITDTGKKVICDVTEQMFNSAKIGQNYEKKANELFPFPIE